MDSNETYIEVEEISFGKEIAKTFAISAAASAGTIAGFVVIGYAYGKIIDCMETRKAKKNSQTEEN